jgi:NADPH2:quinone reductase
MTFIKPASMRALLVHQLGWPNTMTVEQYPLPQIEPDHVLVKVRAAGLNFADSLVIGGTYQEKPPLPFIPGAELVGDVVACSSDTSHVKVGDRVMGQVPSGAFAEYVAVHEHRLVKVPPLMRDEEAAGFYIPYGTAICALRERGRLKAGETLLVLGAAGAVGLAAVQVGKALGARVIGVSRNSQKKQAVLDSGADAFVVYESGDLKATLKQAGCTGGIDVVLDVVGGETTQQAMRCLGFEGRLVILGFTSGDSPLLKSNHILVKNIDIVGCYWGPYQTMRPEATRASFDDLLAWHAQGQIRPHIAGRVALEGVGEALVKLVTGGYTGKVVVDVSPEGGTP